MPSSLPMPSVSLWGRGGLRTGSQTLPHDRAGLLAPCHLSKAGTVVHRSSAEPHEVVVARLGFVDGIGLDEANPLRPRVVHGGPKELLRHASAPLFRIHEEA